MTDVNANTAEAPAAPEDSASAKGPKKAPAVPEDSASAKGPKAGVQLTKNIVWHEGAGNF